MEDVRHALGLWTFPRGLARVPRGPARRAAQLCAEALFGSRDGHSGANATARQPDATQGNLGWRSLADGVQTRMVHGAHDTIVREPRVRELAAVLTPLLASGAAQKT